MVIIIGMSSDPPTRLLINSLESKQISFHFFNQKYSANFQIKYSYQNRLIQGFIADNHKQIDLNEITGIYFRPLDYTLMPTFKNLSDEKKNEVFQFYAQTSEYINTWNSEKTVNAPFFMQSNNSKPYQANIINSCGLGTPNTILTNEPEIALEFIEKYDKVIYKSTSGVRSIVKTINSDDIENLIKIKYCPVQFQECIIGYNVRVHVIGKNVIATKIDSDATDYRYAKQENKQAILSSYTLADDIKEKCILLSQKLKLNFTGIDLMFADDGRVICFEVNPSPGYSYYQESTGQMISDILADFLGKKRL